MFEKCLSYERQECSISYSSKFSFRLLRVFYFHLVSIFLLENNLMEIEKHDLNLAFTIFKKLQMTLQNL